MDKLKENGKGRTPSQSDATNGLGELHGCLKPRRKDQDLPDPADLNKAVKREHYPIPTVEEIVATIPNATVLQSLMPRGGIFK